MVYGGSSHIYPDFCNFPIFLYCYKSVCFLGISNKSYFFLLPGPLRPFCSLPRFTASHLCWFFLKLSKLHWSFISNCINFFFYETKTPHKRTLFLGYNNFFKYAEFFQRFNLNKTNKRQEYYDVKTKKHLLRPFIHVRFKCRCINFPAFLITRGSYLSSTSEETPLMWFTLLLEITIDSLHFREVAS